MTELVQFIDLAELVLSFGTNPEFDGLKWTDSEKYGHMTSTDLYGDGPDFKLREFDARIACLVILVLLRRLRPYSYCHTHSILTIKLLDIDKMENSGLPAAISCLHSSPWETILHALQ